MFARSRLLAAFLLALVVVPAHAQKRRAAHYPLHAPPPPRDSYSAARPAEVRTGHLTLDLQLDFDARRIDGVATHRIVNFTGAQKFVVDTRNLEITGVEIDGARANYTLAPSTPALGRPLTIDITPATKVVRIAYRTSPISRALTWQTARQTTGNLGPFVFTLSQPDRAREWIPVQDTPGVRMTYEATVRVPAGMLALMSASNNPRAPSANGVYTFRQGRTLPAYLIALAAGHVEFHELDERTGMYVEAVLANDALWDLQDIPRQLDAAERILGTYPWSRYDIVLIPGFSAGGMENPDLNFINAAYVTGNHETPPVPNAVIAHEIAHSWGGDLATCATWSDTWLNEGFATYMQKRIDEEVSGAEVAELGYYFDRRSYTDFMNATQRSPQVQVLHREFLEGESLSVFTTTNYQKGSIFLKTLEDHLGRPAFDAFLREYFRRFAYRWVDVNAFLDTLGPVDPKVRIAEWLFAPGLPSNVTAPERSRLWDRAGVQAAAFRSGGRAASLDTSGWTSREVGLFLWQITDIIRNDMPGLDAKFGLSRMNRPSMHWFYAVADTMYGPGLPAMERFMMLNVFDVAGIYDRLSRTPAGREYALRIYGTARERYSPSLQAYVDRVLNWTGAMDAEDELAA